MLGGAIADAKRLVVVYRRDRAGDVAVAELATARPRRSPRTAASEASRRAVRGNSRSKLARMKRLPVMAALVLLASVAACKSKKSDDTATVASGSSSGSGSGSASASASGSGSGSATEGSAEAPGPTPTWSLESAPVDVDCGDAALDLPKPHPGKPKAARALARGPGIAACHALASVDAVCGCLASSAGTWASDTVTAPVQCTITTIDGLTDPHVAIVGVTTEPSDTATKFDGRALVLLAQQGSTWSAVDTVESVTDIDHAVTPKRSGTAQIDRVTAQPGRAGTLYIIQSRSWTSEHALGETDADGTAQVTVCSVPRTPGTPAFCFQPLALARWTFTHDDSSDACTVPTADFFTATITASTATVRLVHGKDDQSEAGRYVF